MNRVNRRDFIKFALSSGALLTLGSGSELVTKTLGKGTHTKKSLSSAWMEWIPTFFKFG